MAFRIPTFNLKCYIWRATNSVLNPADVESDCQIRFPGRFTGFSTDPDPDCPQYIPWDLLLPARTDIRGRLFRLPALGDTVECPKLSGIFYTVHQVGDVGRGFSNEYRLAYVFMTLTPYPIP